MTPAGRAARLFWDQGGLWSLMTWEACQDLGLGISPITATEIAAGGLDAARLLVVPGGWPSLKRRALGRAGAGALRAFLENGGLYLGLCGGAGLALDVADGLGLVDLERVSRDQRLAGANGPIQVEITAPERPMWQGLESPSPFNVWFPAQFHPPRNQGVQVLASYGPPAPGMCSADLPVDQVAPSDWAKLENRYGINLNPALIQGLPAVVQAPLGKGRLILSHLHFDTPGDQAGGRVLGNLWRSWLGCEPAPSPAPRPEKPPGEMSLRAEELWKRGERLGLWRPRTPILPLWRRGTRGLEFWSLLRLCRAVDQGRDALPRGSRDQLARILEAVWRDGAGVLTAQAAILEQGADYGPGNPAHGRWFGAPRRVGGELAKALDLLEDALLIIVRQGG